MTQDQAGTMTSHSKATDYPKIFAELREAKKENAGDLMELSAIWIAEFAARAMRRWEIMPWHRRALLSAEYYRSRIIDRVIIKAAERARKIALQEIMKGGTGAENSDNKH